MANLNHPSPYPFRHPPELLRHRRQWVIGTRKLDFAGWRSVEIAGRVLTHHPELPVEVAAAGDAGVAILGEMLDPDLPRAGNRDIAAQLVREVAQAADLLSVHTHLARMMGRWILVVWRGGAARLITDALGSRQVYYAHEPGSGAVWCAAQPGLLADALGFREDPRFTEYARTADYTEYRQAWWPGDQTPFQEVRLLIPNHDMDLVGDGGARRYWPTAPAVPGDFHRVVRRVAQLLKGAVTAAAHRRPLSLPITAGRDSRTVLAACKDVADKVFFNTFFSPRLLRRDMPDIRLPPRLCRKLGLRHTIIECPASPHPGFMAEYSRNHVYAHAHADWAALAQGFYENVPEGLWRMTATGGEVCRTFYAAKKEAGDGPVTSETIARVMQVSPHPWILAGFDGWLATIREAHGYELLDLCYWEQRDGSWAAMNFTEWDFVEDVFSPFNSRELFAAMLSLPRDERALPEARANMAVIRELWPEVLDEPVNPAYTVTRLALLVRRAEAAYHTVRRMGGALLRRLGLRRGHYTDRIA